MYRLPAHMASLSVPLVEIAMRRSVQYDTITVVATE